MAARSPFSLEGRTALVTGANTGIGQGIALALAEAGASVVAAGRSGMDETLALIAEAGGAGYALQVDLQQTGIAERVIAEAANLAGPLDILVNNAGIIRRADALDFSESDWDEVMNVNLKANFFLAQAFAKAALSAGRTGRIVNIASLLSFQGGIRVASYTASKSGLAGLTKPRLRMGSPWHQCERHRARLYRKQQHAGAARRRRPEQRDPRPHPGRPLGQTRGHRRRGGLPRQRRRRLHAWRGDPRGRRLAGAMTNRLNSFFQHEADYAWEPTEPGVKRKIMAYGEDLMVVRVVRGRLSARRTRTRTGRPLTSRAASSRSR